MKSTLLFFSLQPSSFLFAACLCIGVAFLFISASSSVSSRRADAPAPRGASAEEVDAALQRAAALALGGREGTIVVLDAQTGRMRAVVNEDLAASAAFPPGSAVKPFTLLTALREKIVDADTRLLCRKHYRRGATEFTCSHPVYKTLFDPAHALAHSCNYFFAHLGERLDAADFTATLAAYGLGAATNDAARASNENATRATVKTNFSRASVRFAHKTSNDVAHADASLAPRLPRGAWRTEDALGEGGGVLVTPLQLVSAYAALANGGHLFEPQRAAPADFSPREKARLTISDEERAVLVAGMRGAVSYGTAERARLDALPLRVFGKTGTATEIGGFRTHGWFVGFASDAPNTPNTNVPLDADAPVGALVPDALAASPAPIRNDQPAPAEVKLAVLVFLKRSQGKECAAVARPIFEEYARLTHGAGDAARTPSTNDAPAAATDDARSGAVNSESREVRAGGSADDTMTVRVRLARDGEIVSMPLGDYLFGVLAAEASTEDEYAAIKALAVTSRTYALTKLARHARDGFDFCTTTHCQRYLRVTTQNARPDFHAMLRRAVQETAGETLRDSRGRLAEAYFSASCGGMTANVQTLWGVQAREPFERGVTDEYCAALPQTRWTDAISARQLATALRADPRTDVGARLSSVAVVKRDATGRAELVSVEGERRKILRGWDFKIIVGRTLGWGTLKSSRFTVERAGQNFIFRGTGFGHGLGLCQAGAHVMARGGASYLQILAHYFPGATVGRRATANNDHAVRDDAPTRPRADATAPLFESAAFESAARVPSTLKRAASLQHAGVRARLTMSSEHFRVNCPARVARTDVESVLRTLEAARADMARRLDAASLTQPSLPTLELNFNETTADFVAATGFPSWVAAVTHGAHVELQPLATLQRRAALKQTLRHEYAHVLIDALSHDSAPLWLAEGLAIRFAGEGAVLASQPPTMRMSVGELERRLNARVPAEEMRSLYAAAYAEVSALVRTEGESRVWRRVAGR
ncbi:MAG: SpoIID/LytB domain-containing protein [Pyrinomonadaceae bacterium]